MTKYARWDKPEIDALLQVALLDYDDAAEALEGFEARTGRRRSLASMYQKAVRLSAHTRMPDRKAMLARFCAMLSRAIRGKPPTTKVGSWAPFGTLGRASYDRLPGDPKPTPPPHKQRKQQTKAQTETAEAMALFERVLNYYSPKLDSLDAIVRVAFADAKAGHAKTSAENSGLILVGIDEIATRLKETNALLRQLLQRSPDAVPFYETAPIQTQGPPSQPYHFTTINPTVPANGSTNTVTYKIEDLKRDKP